MREAISGKCFCGKVSFKTDAEHLWCAHCHCTMCQIAHGAAFVTWVGYLAASVDVVGDDLQWFQSSAEAERAFCKCCGTTLFFRSSRWPGELHIARALIRNESGPAPQVHAHDDTRVPWVHLDDGLPAS